MACCMAWLLILQAVLSLTAAMVENCIKIQEQSRMDGEKFSLRLWWKDICEAAVYLKQERGLRSIYSYMAVTNGVGSGYSPILIAYFRTAPHLSVAMYSLFSVAEFLGRSLGGLVQYRMKMPAKKKFGFAFGVYQFYEVMDMCLLWIPYPLMLVNRACAGFLGINSAAMRQAAVQRYLPEHLRSRVNAFENMCIVAAGAFFSLILGAVGEVLDYRCCITFAAGFTLAVCWMTIWRGRREVGAIYSSE